LIRPHSGRNIGARKDVNEHTDEEGVKSQREGKGRRRKRDKGKGKGRRKEGQRERGEGKMVFCRLTFVQAEVVVDRMPGRDLLIAAPLQQQEQRKDIDEEMISTAVITAIVPKYLRLRSRITMSIFIIIINIIIFLGVQVPCYGRHTGRPSSHTPRRGCTS
jgi:hypothetical protein